MSRSSSIKNGLTGLFRRGPLTGPTILMDLLRKKISHQIALDAYAEKLQEHKDSYAYTKLLYSCGICDELKTLACFTTSKREDHIAESVIQAGATRVCHSCCNIHKTERGIAGGPLGAHHGHLGEDLGELGANHGWKGTNSGDHGIQGADEGRQAGESGLILKTCTSCQQELPKSAFTRREWNQLQSRRCRQCPQQRVKGMHPCRRCLLYLPPAKFSLKVLHKGNHHRICYDCEAQELQDGSK